MICLGLDLSSKPGYAITEDGAKLLRYETGFEIKKKVREQSTRTQMLEYDQIDLAVAVADRISQVVLEHSPDLIFIEQSNQGSGLNAMKGQEFIHYAVLLRLREIGYQDKTQYIYSSTWRSMCGQKMTKEQKVHNKQVKAGTAKKKIKSKHLAVAWANETFGLKLLMKDEDAADAIGISCGGYRKWQSVNSTQQKEISDIDKIFT